MLNINMTCDKHMRLQDFVCLLYSAKLWQSKTLVNLLFQSFVKENVGKFTITNISYLSNLEFGWVKY